MAPVLSILNYAFANYTFIIMGQPSNMLNVYVFRIYFVFQMSLPASDMQSMWAAEAIEVLDKMREGQDILRNNTNSFLSGK